MAKNEELLTLREASELVEIPQSQLVTMIDEGELPFTLIDGQRRLSREAVLDLRGRRWAPLRSRDEQLRGLAEMAETTSRLGLGY